MIRFALAVLTALVVFTPAQKASAHSYHTANVCATTAPEICAHAGFAKQPTATDITSFMLHFMPTVDPTLISKVGVQLWMPMPGHSHPGAPVTVTPKDAVHFEVSNAGFMSMPGPWQIKVSFDYQGAAHELILPIDVL